MVAHDLRNPIGNACVFAELMVTEFAALTAEEHIEFLQVVNERCEYALKLIENFLDASKIEAGILDLNFREHNYYTLLKSCIVHNRTFAKKKSQKLILNCDDESLSVLCDGDKLQQAINNLISNAIKYSLPNKEIRLEVEHKDHSVITRVIDQGQGIPADEIETIFKPFKTSSVKTTAEEKSTGLGLAIVKKMVEAHEGKVEVQSKVGIGSEFSFSLPLK